MTSEELARSLDFGLAHCCCVDIRHVPEAPGYVRTTSLHEGNRVNIEFDAWGMDEGGLYFWGKFETQDHMVQCLEDYLHRPIADWRNLGPRDYLPRPPEAGTPESHQRFRELLASGGPPLPAGGDFRTHDSHWLQFLR